MTKIIGSGGGGKGGGGGGISEDPDTLSTTATARFLDLICEGPIQGFHLAPNADYSIYLDGVPLKDMNGAINYRPYTFQVTDGTANQPVLEGFANIQQENTVGLKVTTGLGIVSRPIPDTGADAVKVTVAFNGLNQTDSQGKVTGATVQYEIYTRVSGGTWRLSLANTVSEKTRSRAQIQHEVLLGDLGAGPYEVGVKRITADSASALLVNDLYWDAYTVVNYEKLNYPYSVLCGVTIDARYFSNVPQRAYHIKGLIVPVPANCVDANGNYDASYRTTGAGTTAGAWNGTFVNAWTNNPVWCLYDLLTNRKHGLGKRIFGEGIVDLINGGTFVTSVDKFTLYTIAKYCDDWVPTGSTYERIGYTKSYGSNQSGQIMASVPTEAQNYERRFTFNAYINTLEDAYKLINNVCSVFRGMSYWGSGQVTMSQDAPGTASKIFTNANVLDGIFSYEGSSRAERHTAVTVAWNDPSEDFKRKYEYVEDRDAILRYGYRPTDTVAFGCTSRNQARRLGRYMLLTERLDTEVIAFKTGIEAATLYPGRLVQVQDNDRAGVRWGGRVKSVTTNRLTWSNDISNAAWTKTNATASTVTLTSAPDGSNLTIALMETATTTSHVLSRLLSFNPAVNHTLSFYAKANGRTQLTAYVFDGPTTGYAYGVFDIGTGTIVSSSAAPVNTYNIRQTITSAGNGWYRCTVSGVPGIAGASTQVQIRLRNGGTETYLGSTSAGVYIWGLQFQESDTVDSLITTTSVSRTRLYFDTPPVTPTNGAYTISCILPNGTLESKPTNFAIEGPQEFAEFDSFSDEPIKNAVWTLASAAVTPITARVISIKEEGINRYAITCVESNQSKYDAIDQGDPVVEQNYSFLSVLPPATPSNLTAVEYAYKPTVSSFTRSDVLVSWDKSSDPTIRGYLVKATSSSETRRYPETVEPRLTLDNVPAGAYVISVESVNYFGIKSSTPATYGLTVLNVDSTPPATVTGFTYSVDANNGLKLSWNTLQDFIDYYEIRVGATWATATLVAKAAGNNQILGAVAAGTYTYQIAAVDTSGNYSTTKATVTVNLTAPTAPSVNSTIQGTDEVIEWSGATSLIAIDRYEVREGASFAAGSFVATTKGTYYRRPLAWTGATRTYWVAAIDAANNVGAAGSDTLTSAAPAAPNLTSTQLGSRLRLDWTVPTSVLPVASYEVRYGASFAAGTSVFKGSSLSLELPITWVGSRIFWVAAIDQAGGVGATDSVEFIVTAPGSVTATRYEVVDNNALLYWSAPTTGNLPIDRYEVRKGASWVAGSVVGSNGTSTFTTIFEQQAGTVNYWIAAYDTAGNTGTPVSITTLINQPPDYVLFSDYTSTFAGTRTNMALVNGALYGAINPDETVEMHYDGGLLSSPDNLTAFTTQFNCTITANAENDAGGFLTADRVNRTAIGDHYLQRTYATTSHANKTYTFSCYIRLGTLTGNIVLNIRDSANTIVGTATVTPTTTIGRYSVTGTFGATPAANIILTINPANDTGTAGDTFFVSNCQLVEGAAPTTYYRTMQDQITAGFPLWLQPTLTSASYQETIDYGTDLASTQVTATLLTTLISGTATVTVQMEYKKAADPTWTAMPANVSTYLAAGGLRYLRLTYTVTSGGGTNLIRFDSLTVKLNLKLKNDSQRSATVLGGAHTQGNIAGRYLDWVAGTTFPVGWQTGANLSGENTIASGTGPGGVTQLMLNCTQVTPAASTWDGQYVTPSYTHDNTQVYLHCVFATKLTTAGTLYFGPGDNGANIAVNAFTNIAGTDSPNPYFTSGGTLLTAGTWYLIVGLIHEVGYSGGQTTISGVYDLAGTRQAFTMNDYIAKSTLASSRSRGGVFGNATDVAGTVTARFCRPMVIKTTRAAAPALIQKVIKDATSFGKEITFGTQFVDVQAIVPSVIGSTPYTPVVDFVDVPYPKSCNVYVFDNAGNRVAQEISILTRGV